MGMEYSILLNDHRFVRLDIEGIFFDLAPSSLVLNIEHKQLLYRKVGLVDKHIFFCLFHKHMSEGKIHIFFDHNSKNWGNRMKHTYRSPQKAFKRGKHMLILIC